MKSALRQNLDLANDLTWPKNASLQSGGAQAGPNTLFSRWQLTYLKAMMARGSKPLHLLKEADRLLTRLPYGYSRGHASLPLQPYLSYARTWCSFNQQHLHDAPTLSE